MRDLPVFDKNISERRQLKSENQPQIGFGYSRICVAVIRTQPIKSSNFCYIFGGCSDASDIVEEEWSEMGWRGGCER